MKILFGNCFNDAESMGKLFIVGSIGQYKEITSVMPFTGQAERSAKKTEPEGRAHEEPEVLSNAAPKNFLQDELQRKCGGPFS